MAGPRARLSGKARAAAAAAAEQRVEEWNRAYPVGTEVLVRRDNGEVLKTTTRGPAGIWDSSPMDPMIMVHGIAGAYLLERVTLVHPATARATGIDLDELAKRAAVTIDVPGAGASLERPTREIRLRAAQGMDFGPFITITAGDLGDDLIAPVLRAAAAAALEVLAEHKP